MEKKDYEAVVRAFAILMLMTGAFFAGYFADLYTGALAFPAILSGVAILLIMFAALASVA